MPTPLVFPYNKASGLICEAARLGVAMAQFRFNAPNLE